MDEIPEGEPYTIEDELGFLAMLTDTEGGMMTDLITAWPCSECSDKRTENGFTECVAAAGDCEEYRAAATLRHLAEQTSDALRTAAMRTIDLQYRREWADRLADAFADMLTDVSAELDRNEFTRRCLPLMERAVAS